MSRIQVTSVGYRKNCIDYARNKGHSQCTLDPETLRKARASVLSAEIHSIHWANRLFWEGKSLNREAAVAYERRKERLETIRSVLSELQKRRTGPCSTLPGDYPYYLGKLRAEAGKQTALPYFNPVTTYASDNIR
jgi:hypothetical protein